jgi:hypothetical protein
MLQSAQIDSARQIRGIHAIHRESTEQVPPAPERRRLFHVSFLLVAPIGPWVTLLPKVGAPGTRNLGCFLRQGTEAEARRQPEQNVDQ